jgi:IclR family transcriptional regulator, KDG regulon repressor
LRYFHQIIRTFIFDAVNLTEQIVGRGKRSYTITALQRGLHLLTLFAGAERGLSASEVAKRSALPVSTVHRFLMNLESSGFLSCSEDGVYHLGVLCFGLGHAALAQLDIRRLSIPFLRELNQATRETIHLTVRHGATAVYVDKLDSPEPVRIYSRIGASVPLYCSAVGKVMLAYMQPQDRDNLLSQVEFKRFTPNTIGNSQELLAYLQRVRRQGFAYDLEENEPHIRCVAAPIWDHAGSVNASLSITGPAVRMSNSRMRELSALVKQAGLNISRELGYEPARLLNNQPAPVNTRDSVARRSAVAR